MKIIRFTGMLLVLFAAASWGCSRGGPAGAAAVRNELRLMTINIWSGLDYKGTLSMGEYESGDVRGKRFRALAAEIRRLSPDIIGINEANPLPDYAEKLAAETGYDCLYHVGVSGLRVWRVGLPWNLREGDAILAKKDLALAYVGREQLSGGLVLNNLSCNTTDATQVLLGRVRVNGEDVYIAVTHWHYSALDDARSRGLLERLKKEGGYPDSALADALTSLAADCKWRRDEAGRMYSFLEKNVPAGKKLFVLGDLNATTGTPEVQRFLSGGYTDTFGAATKAPGYTWDAANNSNIRKYYLDVPPKKHDSLYEKMTSMNDGRSVRIDFILANRALPAGMVRGSFLCCTGYYEGAQPSDHFGVFSVIRMK